MFKSICKHFNVVDVIKQGRRLYANKNTSKTQISNFTNGLKVATEELCSPLACVSLFILTGSRFENECNNGISYFIEHMAYRGFRSMKRDCIESKLNSIGGRLSAYTSREYQRFTAIAPAEFVSDLISMLSFVIYDMEFAEEEIQGQRMKLCTELMENDVNTTRLIYDYLHQTAFQGTPLAQPVTPSCENLNSLNCQTAFQFMQTNYHPKRFVLASSGGVCHKNVVEIATQYFGCDQVSTCFMRCPPQRYTASQIIYRNDAMPFLHTAIAVEAPGYNSEDYYPLLVASCLTDSWSKSQGGNINNASYLARASATSQLCEMYDSFYIAYSDVGLWGVYFVCKMQEPDEFLSNLQESWMRLCTTTSHNDLQRAINIAKLKLARNVNGIVNTCHDIGLQLTMMNRRKSLDMIFNDLKLITPETLIEVGLKYFYTKSPAVVAIGPSEALPDYERIKAGFYWLRW